MKNIESRDCSIPVLGFGTYKLLSHKCIDAVCNAIDIGYRHIDTAQIYENEKEVGKAIRETGIAREEIFLTTKIWIDNFSENRFFNSVDESLDKLQSDYADLLLLHWPHPTLPLKEYVPLLAELKKTKQAKSIGISNFTIAQLNEAQAIAEDQLVTDQVEYHAELSQSKLLEVIRENKMFLTAYCPLGQGNLAKSRALNDIGKRYGKTPAQAALRWLIQQDAVAAIPKTASSKRAKENFSIFDFELSKEEMSKISSMGSSKGRVVNPEFAPNWD